MKHAKPPRRVVRSSRLKPLSTALVAAIAVVIASSTISVLAFRAESRRQEQALRSEVTSLVDAERLVALSERRAHHSRVFLLTGAPELRQSWLGARAEFRATLERLKKTTTTRTGKELLQQIRASQRALGERMHELVRSRQAGTSLETLAARLKTEIQPARAQLDEQLDALVLHQESRLQQALKSAEASRRLALTALLGFAPSALFAALVLAYLTWRAARQRERERTADQGALKQSVESLTMERSKLAAVIAELPVGVALMAPDGDVVLMNQAGLKLHGFQSEAESIARLDAYRRDFSSTPWTAACCRAKSGRQRARCAGRW